MKKTILLLIILLSSFCIFGAERFYCINATDNIGSGNSQYRFNYSTVFDLSDYLTSYPVYNDYAGSNNANGTLNQQRAVGTVGVADCTHKIKYTITATNFGRFESQSDPSKYRNYYVVAVPDQGNGSQRYFYYPNNGSANSVALNTRTGNSMTMTTIKTSGGSYSSMGIDLFVCMEQLTDEDRLHLAPGDDYYATILVEWECAENNCNKTAHSGNFSITIRGYFGSEYTSAYDEIFLLISPTAESNNMNIKEMAKTGNALTISNFQINTVTKRKESGNNTAYDWSKHIFAFLSASPNYDASDANGFLLKKVGNQSITIPYELTVYSTINGNRTNNSRTYDGEDSFATGTASEKNMCLPMYTTDTYLKKFTDTFSGDYYAINYEAEVVLNIEDFEIPGSGQLFSVVMQNPELYSNYYTQYIGRYESNIYYHIVYSDTRLN